MHGQLATVVALARAVAEGQRSEVGCEVAVCPPFVYLPAVAQALASGTVALGAQNVCDREGEGAYTGEISGRMLRELGCRYAIVGHSERRHIYGESDDLIARKFVASQRAGLTPILCVGETLGEREAEATEQVLARQIDAVVAIAGAAALEQSVIAYEPVWAIGTGRTASPAQAEAAHAFIRAQISAHVPAIAQDLRILYGGSVKADNARSLFEQDNVDGGLIGGASLDADGFLKICRQAGVKTS